MFLNWYISTTTIVDLSSGLVALWDPKWVKIKSYKCFAGILLEGNICVLGRYVHILNIYAP